MMYTIIDVETTGRGNRITEISIFKYDGQQVIDEFTSLVNPEITIPMHITALTGIDNVMVADAPKFHEIAEQIIAITSDTIFVAHSVNFDYNVIRNEFKLLGIDFYRKKLCTVRLSRKLIPGEKTYSLGKLCKSLNIPLTDRHRARGDAAATVLLFELLLQQENFDQTIASFFKKSSKEATLPPNLPNTVFNSLPNAAGIYFFKNKKGKVIYVGKAKDIKKRVLSHFYTKTEKELNLCRETADIDFELSGSELIALLMEDAAIKHYFPIYNQASKRRTIAYALFCYEDRKGVKHLAINMLKGTPNPLLVFYNKRDCRSYLEYLCTHFELCPKFCHLQETSSSCSHYAIPCKGVCRNKEDVAMYNHRVKEAIEYTTDNCENLLLKEKGRTDEEEAFVLVKNGKYLGYGFVDTTITITHEDELETFLIPQKDNLDVQKILRSKLAQR